MKIDATYLQRQTMKGELLKKYFQSPANFTLYEVESMLKTFNINIVRGKIALSTVYRHI